MATPGDQLVRPQLLQRYHSLAPRELVTAVLDELGAFLSGLPKTDDVTIAAIRRME